METLVRNAFVTFNRFHTSISPLSLFLALNIVLGAWLTHLESFIWYVCKILWKTNIFYPLILTRVYQ